MSKMIKKITNVDKDMEQVELSLIAGGSEMVIITSENGLVVSMKANYMHTLCHSNSSPRFIIKRLCSYAHQHPNGNFLNMQCRMDK